MVLLKKLKTVFRIFLFNKLKNYTWTDKEKGWEPLVLLIGMFAGKNLLQKDKISEKHSSHFSHCPRDHHSYHRLHVRKGVNFTNILQAVIWD